MTNRKSDIAAFLQRWYLSHPLLALVKMTPFLLASLAYPPALWIGAAVAVSFYYGREVAHVGAALPDNRWWEGYLPTRWKRDNHLDFWPVVLMAVCTVVPFMWFI